MRGIHQVREETGDQALDTAEEEPGAGAGGYTREGRRQEIRLRIQQRRRQEQELEDTPGTARVQEIQLHIQQRRSQEQENTLGKASSAWIQQRRSWEQELGVYLRKEAGDPATDT